MYAWLHKNCAETSLLRIWMSRKPWRVTFSALTGCIVIDGLQEKFASMIADAGFQKVEYENLVGGVVAIHSGIKIWYDIYKLYP